MNTAIRSLQIHVGGEALVAFQMEKKTFETRAETRSSVDLTDMLFTEEVYPVARRYPLRSVVSVTVDRWPYNDADVKDAIADGIAHDVRAAREIDSIRAQAHDIHTAAAIPAETREEQKERQEVARLATKEWNSALCAAPIWPSKIFDLDFKAIQVPEIRLSEEAEARRSAEEAASKEAIERVKAEEASRKAAEKAAREAADAEWISRFGSEQLQRAYEKGYPVKRLLLEERVHQLFPTLETHVDWLDGGGTEDKSGPSLAALEAADDIQKALGPEIAVRVVWTNRFWTDDEDEDGVEAIRIVRPFGQDKDIYVIL